MTRLSMTYPALAVTLTLATPVAAYEVEPVSADVRHVGLTTPAASQSAQLEDACKVTLTPSLLAILGLEDGLPTPSAPPQATALACDTQ